MKLTAREKQVVDKVCAFKPRKTIASEIGISVSTVDVYLLRVRRKFGLSGMVELAVYFSGQVMKPRSQGKPRP